VNHSGHLFELDYDYLQQDGNYIIFSKDSLFSSKDLKAIQVQMLQYNRVPHLLPFEKDELNSAIRLLYRFTNKKMLSHEIRMNPLNLSDYYKLLLSIVEILLDSKLYMLNEGKYILRDDFIFVGRDYSDIHLIYLPVQSLPGKESVQAELYRLSMNLVMEIKEMKGHGFQQLVKMLNDENASLSDLQKQLNVLLEEEIKYEEAYSRANVSREPNEFDENFKPKREGMNLKWIVYGVSFVLLALTIILFTQYPHEGVFFICIGLGVLIIDSAYIVLKYGSPTSKQRKKKGQSQSETGGTQISEISSSYYNELPQHTTFLKKSDATELLKPEMLDTAGDRHRPRIAFLLIDPEGSAKKYEITGERFVIGRDMEVVDYRIDSIGVSRMHCEITYKEENYLLKDLGSSNKTYLNNEPLVPYKTYKLNEGDRIKIVRSEMKFHHTNDVKIIC
jgi:hypothetical protein